MLAASFTPGCRAEDLRVEQCDLPSPQAGEVLLRVRSTAINRADTLQRLGRYKAPSGESEILGLEAAGIVQSVEAAPHAGWNVGDRAMALLGGGGNAQFVCARADQLMPIADTLSFDEAAAIPEAWLTAFQLLSRIGGVCASDTVLVHAAASGVGTAALQLLRVVFGAPTTVATVGSDEKAAFVSQFGADHVINYKTADFSAEVLRITGGKGADVILDCVGGSNWEKNAACVAVDGRWVLYGLLGGGVVEGALFGRLLQKRVRLEATTLRARSNQYKAALVADFTKLALPHFSSGKLRPVIHERLPLKDIGLAHRHMEDNLTKGKIVLNVE